MVLPNTPSWQTKREVNGYTHDKIAHNNLFLEPRIEHDHSWDPIKTITIHEFSFTRHAQEDEITSV